MTASAFARRLASVSAAAALAAAAFVAGMPANSLANSLQDQTSLLTIRENLVQVQLTRAKLQQYEPLAEKGIVSKTDIEQKRADARLAEIRFQRSVMDLVSTEPKITVERAVKVKGKDGQQYLELALRNATLLVDDSQQMLFASMDKDLAFPREILQRRLDNVFISVREANNFAGGAGAGAGTGYAQGQFAMPSQVAVAIPYDLKIGSWSYNETKVLRFRLLTDAERFNIHITYRSSEHEIGVYAEQKFQSGDVELTAGRINQEANLGSAIDYPFEIRRSGQDSRAFFFQVYNLPPSISYSIVSADGKSRVSQVRLENGETARPLMLRLELPARHVEGFKLDAPLPFIVAAVDEKNVAKLPAGDRKVAETDFSGQSLGSLELKLVARGLGKLSIVANSLVHELVPGAHSEFGFTVKNEGSSSLENIRFDSEKPNGIGVAFEPALITSVGVGQEKKVKVRVTTPNDSAVGEYELRVKTEGYSSTRPLAIDEKVFRLVVKSGPSMLPVFVVLFLFLAVLLIIVYVGKKVRLR
ncbi:NEW3 domain-containing protein [Herbaspirillum sp. SJZ107]|uniref:COG1470 family protein n=1 Tax=Herbaspirillum sp. SJZ107 TaxID=2572881 RepID=UPI00116C9B2F|nr:NEW3 domain-containing protein [Herbaspirillum sp. SJZ107]TQK03371.1 alpha-galactosidase-like protein [Herbaspirillum sp. SJZ107]